MARPNKPRLNPTMLQMMVRWLGVGCVVAGMAGWAVAQAQERAVVIVSGGAAVSPFTTPSAGCAKGFAAGSTDDHLRQALIKAGYAVFTSPARVGPGPIAAFEGAYGFSDCPTALPASMTVDSVGEIDAAGVRLAAFFEHLRSAYGVTTVDVVGHSMGGLFSRAAFGVLKAAGSSIRVRSLTTIGTPWEGAFPADVARGDLSPLACLGDAMCLKSVDTFKTWGNMAEGAAPQVTRAYLTGAGGWNERQKGVLDDVPVTLIAGDYAQAPSAPANASVWPNDALVAARSALAQGVSDAVLPHRRCLTQNGVHSIFYTDLMGLDRGYGITFDPRTVAAVQAAIEDAPTFRSRSNRAGCPGVIN